DEDRQRQGVGPVRYGEGVAGIDDRPVAGGSLHQRPAQSEAEQPQGGGARQGQPAPQGGGVAAGSGGPERQYHQQGSREDDRHQQPEMQGRRQLPAAG